MQTTLGIRAFGPTIRSAVPAGLRWRFIDSDAAHLDIPAPCEPPTASRACGLPAA